jgi:hypothetical protein
LPVETVEGGATLLQTLAAYDAFQYENNVKPDYCNAGGLSVFEDGEWVDWYSSDGEDINEYIQGYPELQQRLKKAAMVIESIT